MKKLATFNTLPPKEEYITLVTEALREQKLSLGNLIQKTKLTKTQVACTLDKLIADNLISQEKIESKTYYKVKDEL